MTTTSSRRAPAWCAHHWPGASHEVVELTRPNSGWANETLLVTTSQTGTTERRDRFVVRLPPTLPTWPSYDLAAQARVLAALAPSAVPVPGVVAIEDDAQWLGAPFLVMSHEPGRAGAEVPALDPWFTDAPVAAQRSLHEAFVTMLAAIHRVDWLGTGLDDVLRTSESSLVGEIDWWSDYIEWAADEDPSAALTGDRGCATTAPDHAAAIVALGRCPPRERPVA